MEEVVIPYELPETDNHSFFFINQRIDLRIEAKMHRHDAWELYCVIQGQGVRTVGDTVLPFKEGDVVLLPPSIHHQWNYNPLSADEDGCVHYLMVAFEHSFICHCITVFPELRNRLAGMDFPVEALKFGAESARIIRRTLSVMSGMDELGRLCEMLRLLPMVFAAKDYTFVGRPMRIEREVRRMQHVFEYVMAIMFMQFRWTTLLLRWE